MAGRISIIPIIGSEPGGRPDTMRFPAWADGSLNEPPVKTAQNKDCPKQAEAKPGANAVERRTSKEDRMAPLGRIKAERLKLKIERLKIERRTALKADDSGTGTRIAIQSTKNHLQGVRRAERIVVGTHEGTHIEAEDRAPETCPSSEVAEAALAANARIESRTDAGRRFRIASERRVQAASRRGQ